MSGELGQFLEICALLALAWLCSFVVCLCKAHEHGRGWRTALHMRPTPLWFPEDDEALRRRD